MTRIMKQLLPVVLMLVIFSGCYTDNYESLYNNGGCKVDSVAYSGNIKDIFTQNCALSGCHNTATHQSGVILDTYTGAHAAATGTRLIGAITHASGYFPMPQNANKLNDCTINQITRWATMGAPNN